MVPGNEHVRFVSHAIALPLVGFRKSEVPWTWMREENRAFYYDERITKRPIILGSKKFMQAKKLHELPSSFVHVHDQQHTGWFNVESSSPL